MRATMTVPTPPPARNVFDLSRDARQALAMGDTARAVSLLRKALDQEPGALGLWLNYAAALRQSGDLAAALIAVDEALTIEPRDFAGLLMKGSLLEKSGEMVEAGRFYGLALLFRDQASEDPATQTALKHAEAVNADYVRELTQAIDAVVQATIGPAEALNPNARRFWSVGTGRSRHYQPEPSTYLYPGLPSYEFYPRGLTPWIERFEGFTEVIRKELDAAMQARPELFTPYVNEPPGVPVDQWKELNHSPRWAALQVVRAGERMPYAEDLFPRTLEALSGLPQPDVPGRTPSAMFSALHPRTRIPSHTGVSNARLVAHLPLIVPPGCGFRVGSETQAWEVGKAWVFDDTIEHEAWNDSDELRVILIADIWNMFMTDEDRQVYCSIVGAIDGFHGWSSRSDQGTDL
jgi:tetratricopeptide (TPR) repeat protein